MRKFFLGALALVLVFCSCEREKTLKVAATPVPHADLLEVIQPDLEEEGVKLKIVEVDDYNLPNRLLAEGQVDANFFQHKPYLTLQNNQFGYQLEPLTSVHIEPLGIYSKRISSFEDLPSGAIIAIPNDPTNEARALDLLADVGLIELKDPNNPLSTVHDIQENPKKLKIEEVDAAFLPRTLSDVDLAVIPVNFALQAKLNPEKDALALETSDSPYANIIAIRAGEEKRPELQKLKEALNSEKLYQHIKDHYHGAITPAFEP